MSWYHCNSIKLHVGIVEITESSVHSIVQVSHEDTKIAWVVAFKTIYLTLNMLQSQFSDDLACHLISCSHIILSVSKMSGYDVKSTILKGKIVGYGTFIANHSTHGTFRYLHCTDICRFLEKFFLDEDKKKHFPHFRKIWRYRCEAHVIHISFYFDGAAWLELSRAFLDAEGD